MSLTNWNLRFRSLGGKAVKSWNCPVDGKMSEQWVPTEIYVTFNVISDDTTERNGTAETGELENSLCWEMVMINKNGKIQSLYGIEECIL